MGELAAEGEVRAVGLVAVAWAEAGGKGRAVAARATVEAVRAGEVGGDHEEYDGDADGVSAERVCAERGDDVDGGSAGGAGDADGVSAGRVCADILGQSSIRSVRSFRCSIRCILRRILRIRSIRSSIRILIRIRRNLRILLHQYFDSGSAQHSKNTEDQL